VQDAGDADFGAQMFGVGGNREHGVRGGLEQESVNLCLVLPAETPGYEYSRLSE